METKKLEEKLEDAEERMPGIAKYLEYLCAVNTDGDRVSDIDFIQTEKYDILATKWDATKLDDWKDEIRAQWASVYFRERGRKTEMETVETAREYTRNPLFGNFVRNDLENYHCVQVCETGQDIVNLAWIDSKGYMGPNFDINLQTKSTKLGDLDGEKNRKLIHDEQEKWNRLEGLLANNNIKIGECVKCAETDEDYKRVNIERPQQSGNQRISIKSVAEDGDYIAGVLKNDAEGIVYSGGPGGLGISSGKNSICYGIVLFNHVDRNGCNVIEYPNISKRGLKPVLGRLIDEGEGRVNLSWILAKDKTWGCNPKGFEGRGIIYRDGDFMELKGKPLITPHSKIMF
jgi:hypothetical protein